MTPSSNNDDLSTASWRWLNEFALWLHGEHRIPAIQRESLSRLAHAVPCKAALFDLCRSDGSGHIEYVDPVGLNISDASIHRYYQEFSQQDYTTWSFNAHEPVIYRDLDIVDAALRDASPIYREWMAPQGFYYGMGCTIVANGVLFGSVTLFRGREDGDFSDAELEILRQVDRHLCVRFGDSVHAASESGIPLSEAFAARDRLAPREMEVLNLMLSGKTNREMAETLFISESTLKKHVNAIYHKLGVRNRMELAGRFGQGIRPETP